MAKTRNRRGINKVPQPKFPENRLVLVRKVDMRAEFTGESGLDSYIEPDAIDISPLAWPVRQGLSHYGFIVKDLNLAGIELFDEFESKYPRCTVLTFEVVPDEVTAKPRLETVDEVLYRVGLRVHPLA